LEKQTCSWEGKEERKKLHRQDNPSGKDDERKEMLKETERRKPEMETCSWRDEDRRRVKQESSSWKDEERRKVKNEGSSWEEKEDERSKFRQESSSGKDGERRKVKNENSAREEEEGERRGWNEQQVSLCSLDPSCGAIQNSTEWRDRKMSGKEEYKIQQRQKKMPESCCTDQHLSQLTGSSDTYQRQATACNLRSNSLPKQHQKVSKAYTEHAIDRLLTASALPSQQEAWCSEKLSQKAQEGEADSYCDSLKRQESYLKAYEQHLCYLRGLEMLLKLQKQEKQRREHNAKEEKAQVEKTLIRSFSKLTLFKIVYKSYGHKTVLIYIKFPALRMPRNIFTLVKTTCRVILTLALLAFVFHAVINTAVESLL
jgi:hypothetical protein